MLDGKEISPTSRQFLQNWQASKAAQKKRRDDLELNGAGEVEQSVSYGLGMLHIASDMGAHSLRYGYT